MTAYDTVLYFGTGDPETVAQFRVTCRGDDPGLALVGLLDMLGDTGFTVGELVQVVITRERPDVARNLLAYRP